MKVLLYVFIIIAMLLPFCSDFEDNILQYTIKGDSPVTMVNGEIFMGMGEDRYIYKRRQIGDELELEIINLSSEGTYIQLIVYINLEEIHNQIEVEDYAEIYYKK